MAFEVDEPLQEDDAFARMVALLRRVTGYDPGAEDEEHDEPAAARTRRWAARTLLFVVIVLALLNAASLQSWSLTLQPGWGAQTLRRLSEVWSERTAAAGLDRPRQAIRRSYQSWKGSPPPAAMEAGPP